MQGPFKAGTSMCVAPILQLYVRHLHGKESLLLVLAVVLLKHVQVVK
jgi:hypothetical protein